MNDLIKTLHNGLEENQESWSIYVSSGVDQDTLNKHGINFSTEEEGIRIDFLAQKEVKIFKTKDDFYTYSAKGDFNKKIIIIKDNLLYTPDSDAHFIFDNVKYSFKFFDFLVGKIASHQDIGKMQLILLSTKFGKDVVGYQRSNQTNLDKDLELKGKYQEIKNKPDDFLSFFRNSILSYIEPVGTKDRYIRVLENIDIIYQNAERNFNLYKSKFNFDDFKKNLESNTQKYIKDTQGFISDFQSKIDMPIQFGVYIYLISKFSSDFYPLIAVTVIIITWSIFKLMTINNTKNNIQDLEESYLQSFNELSNIFKQQNTEEEINNAKQKICKKIKRTKILIKAYFWTIALFSLSTLFIVFCLLSK